MKAKQQEICIENLADRQPGQQGFFTWQARGIGFFPAYPAAAAAGNLNFPANPAGSGFSEPPVQLRGILQYSPSNVLPADAEVFFSVGRSRCRRDLSYVRSYIFRHYPERLTVHALAALIGVTPTHLGRIFLKTEGVSLRTFIENTRLERAAALLRGTDRNVTAIAKEVGFVGGSYFCLRFKDAYGSTPGVYRRQCRAKLKEKDSPIRSSENV